jgi:thioredoxin reductase (NADPH)
MTVRHEKIVIVGAGPAGLTAAIYAARAGLKPLVIEKLQPGGMMMTTDLIENYPGFDEGVNGADLSLKMHQHAERFGARFEFGETHAALQANGGLLLQTDLGEIAATVVIAATGTEHRLLGIPGEQKFFGRGVSICGTCDGPFYKGRAVGVVGGGNSAIQEGLYVARFASEVNIIHRRDELRADKILADRALAAPNIKFVWSSVVLEVLGQNAVEGLRVQNKKTGEVSTLPVHGFFEFIGLIPNSKWLKNLAPLSEEGFVVTNEFGETEIPGLFAAGDVRRKPMRQIATAVGDGSAVVRTVEKYLESKAG